MKHAREIMKEVVEQAKHYAPDPLTGEQPSKPVRKVVLTNATEIKPEPIRWLWKHWLALGKLEILAGAPGQGKTTIALALAATVSSGGTWPDGSRCEPGSVLVWSGEDDPADTLLPRLLAAGADPARCYFVKGTRVGGELQPFDPAFDMPELEAAAQSIGDVRLLIVDPVVSAVAGDDHKNAAVRRSLAPLVDLAERLSLAVLGISHFSKGGAGSDPTSRVVGSVAYGAVARVVLVAAKLQKFDAGDKRIFARSKSNIGPDDGGFEYRIEQTEAIPGICASYIQWGDFLDGNARDLLAEPDQDGEDIASDQDVTELLRQELTAQCWTPSAQVIKSIEKLGFSNKKIWQASKKLGVIRKKVDLTGGWYWRLPPGAGGPEEVTPA